MARGAKPRLPPTTVGAAQFQAYLKARGWTQTDAAHLLDWSLTRLHRLLTGSGEASAQEAFELQDFTDGEISARAWTVALPAQKRKSS